MTTKPKTPVVVVNTTEKARRFPSAVLIATLLVVAGSLGFLAVTGKLFQQHATATADATAYAKITVPDCPVWNK